MSASATGRDAKPNGKADSRAHHDGSSSRAFTVEQKAAVIRVRRCSPTAFYDILGLEAEKTTVSDAGIKKAYRKLSLLTHPDKNGYTGADEAFKMVSRAFQILSDPDKKSKFDKFGGDPDNRFSSASTSSPFSGFARSPGARGGGGSMWEEEISPEDLFRQFFGGGGPMGGGLFNTGPGFVFNMGGGPGVRVHQFGGGRPRRRPAGANQGPAETPSSVLQTFQNLLPLLLLFLFPLLSSWFSSESSGQSYGHLPKFAFDAHPPYELKHTSHSLGQNYYVNPSDVQDWGARNWQELDRHVESYYVQVLTHECQIEQRTQEQMFQDAQGWFWADMTKVSAAQKWKKTSCRKLKAHGLTVPRHTNAWVNRL